MWLATRHASAEKPCIEYYVTNMLLQTDRTAKYDMLKHIAKIKTVHAKNELARKKRMEGSSDSAGDLCVKQRRVLGN